MQIYVHDVFSASRLHAYCVRTHVNDVICVSYVIMYESIHIQRLADNLQNVYIQCDVIVLYLNLNLFTKH